jgi:chromosome segregation ATPase
MSTVAKIFVILNFVLAAVLLGSAAAELGHEDNWKVRHDKTLAEKDGEIANVTKLLNEERGNVKTLQANLNQAGDERNQAREKADALQTAYEQIKKSYDELNASLANQSKALQIAQNTIQEGRKLVDQLQQERQVLTDNLSKASEERVAAVKMQNQLELNLEQLTAQLQDTQAKLATADGDLKGTRFRLESILRSNPGIDQGAEQPAQTAKVLAADNAANIVVVSLGAEDGVKEGFRYTLSRGNQYVATIQITNVQAKQSAGKVMTGMSKMPVAAGDDAMTAR